MGIWDAEHVGPNVVITHTRIRYPDLTIVQDGIGRHLQGFGKDEPDTTRSIGIELLVGRQHRSSVIPDRSVQDQHLHVFEGGLAIETYPAFVVITVARGYIAGIADIEEPGDRKRYSLHIIRIVIVAQDIIPDDKVAVEVDRLVIPFPQFTVRRSGTDDPHIFMITGGIPIHIRAESFRKAQPGPWVIVDVDRRQDTIRSVIQPRV